MKVTASQEIYTIECCTYRISVTNGVASVVDSEDTWRIHRRLQGVRFCPGCGTKIPKVGETI